MKIIFVESRDNKVLEYYAIAQLEVYKGKLYDELFYAEIVEGTKRDTVFTPKDGGGTFRVIWEDDYWHPAFFTELQLAKDYVLKNFERRTPFINGHVHDVE